MNKQKIFIIGLPRTGTTSVCSTMLDLGYTVAHTAYVQKAFDDAQVIADTPIFNDYQKLDKTYPNSQFIYLSREPSKWVPSIKQLLQRMAINVMRTDGGFNPAIKRCFTDIFTPFTSNNIASEDFLLSCYKKHQSEVLTYFKQREHDLLTIDISDRKSYSSLLNFLDINTEQESIHFEGDFPQLNKGAKITQWKDIKHTSKVASTKNGRIELL